MSLRQQVVRGGAFLAVRQGIGMIVGLAGVLLVTRIIGPANYGLYAASFGLFTYLQTLTLWGVNVYLIRREGDDPPVIYDLAFTLLLVLGGAGALVGTAAIPLLKGWMRLSMNYFFVCIQDLKRAPTLFATAVQSPASMSAFAVAIGGKADMPFCTAHVRF